MNRPDQIEFVTSLCNSIRADIVAKIEAGRIPDSWDGHELREYLAEAVQASRSNLMRNDRKRRKDYKNDVLVRCL